jgi:hypothetical protein
MKTDTESKPRRVGDVRKPWNRPAAVEATRSEWEVVAKRMLAIINPDRKRAPSCHALQEVRPHEVRRRGAICTACRLLLKPLKAYTPSRFNDKVSAFCGIDEGQRLGRLLKLEGDCREALQYGFGTGPRRIFGEAAYAKCFEVSLKAFGKRAEVKTLELKS